MEHKSISLADQVFERLETDILGGKYKRGDLLTENILVADLGVSRTPIREALRRLSQEHIIEITPKGILVLGVTREDICDIMNIRLRIEGYASARAAESITEEQLSELREALELQEYYLTKKDAEHIKSFDSAFHHCLFKFSGSSVIYDTLVPLHKKTQKYRKASVENSGRADESVKEHRAIFEAIAAHNPVLAEEETIKHIENAKNHIMNRGESK